MAELTLDSSEKASITVKIGGTNQFNNYHFDFTPEGVAEIGGGYVSAIDDGETVLRTWPMDQADRSGPVYAEATITVTGDAMTIEFGALEPK